MNDMHVQTATPFFNLSLSTLVDPPYGAEPADFSPNGGPGTEPYELAILSVDGPDRVGLVSRLCHLLEKNTVNIESGRAGLLSSLRDAQRTAFVGQYMLSAEPEEMEGLRQTLRSSNRLPGPFEADTGADISTPFIEAAPPPALHYEVTVYADDQPGILARVADLMAENGYNITSQLCQTILGPAPRATCRRQMRQAPGLFRLQMDVDVPQVNAQATLRRVRAGLAALASEHAWAVKFEESLTTARLTRALSGIAGCIFS